MFCIKISVSNFHDVSPYLLIHGSACFSFLHSSCIPALHCRNSRSWTAYLPGRSARQAGCCLLCPYLCAGKQLPGFLPALLRKSRCPSGFPKPALLRLSHGGFLLCIGDISRYHEEEPPHK